MMGLPDDMPMSEKLGRVDVVTRGLGRIVALYDCSATSHQNR
jgi:hypothetical protein